MALGGTHDYDEQKRLGHLALGLTQEEIIVVPGDVIHEDYSEDGSAGFLQGHGTYALSENKLAASVAGVVERVNKLVSGRPLKSRYVAETGDVVVGEVIEIAQKKWKVHLNGQQDAQLMLSAINLVGGVQRRRTHEDELNMRTYFSKGDVISAEVQTVLNDGTVALHTRSTKYGKLQYGQLVRVCPNLVKRLKQHFSTLEECGNIDVIIGCNGFIWIGSMEAEIPGTASGGNEEKIAEVRSQKDRECLIRVANSVKALNELFLPINFRTITIVYKLSESQKCSPKDMNETEFRDKARQELEKQLLEEQ